MYLMFNSTFGSLSRLEDIMYSIYCILYNQYAKRQFFD